MISLSPEKCLEIGNTAPSDIAIEREKCSICKVIVENANKWDWKKHYDALCEGVPPHAMEWVRVY